MTRILPLGVALAVLTAALPARADAEADAKALFQQGREFRAANDCEHAAPLFHKAYIAYPQGLGSLRNLAECEEQLGHFAASRRWWLDIKRTIAATAKDDPKYEGWEHDADEAAARLKTKVGAFTVDVNVKTPDGEGPANDKTGVELFVNDEALGTKLVSAPLERDPGTYKIRAAIRDAQPVEQTITLNAGDNTHVPLILVRSKSDRVLSKEEQALSDRSRAQKKLAILPLAVGVAGLVAGGIFLALRQGKLDDLKAACPDYENRCTLAEKPIIDDGKLYTTLMYVFGAVGIAGVAGGIALWTTAPEDPAKQKALTISPGIGRLDATLRF